MMLLLYKSKKELRASVGKRLRYRETSIFGNEYLSNGTFTGARRPYLQGGGREFFAKVTMKNDMIEQVL